MSNSNILFLSVALCLLSIANVAKAIILPGTTNITQVQVVATGLTCSNPSPLSFRAPLQGATASLTCDQGLTLVNSSTTDSTGSLTITVNNAVTGRLDFPSYCRVLISLPANCTIVRAFQTIDRLVSLSVRPTSVVNNAVGGGQTLLVTARVFVAA